MARKRRPTSSRKRGSAAARRGLPAVLAVLAVVAVGCSGGGGHRKAATGLPDPAPGKIAVFDLNTLSNHYDLQGAVSDLPGFSHVASDVTGNAYLMDGGQEEHVDILRLTPQGTVSRFASLFNTRTIAGLAALPGGVLAVGQEGGLLRVDGHSTPTAMPTGHTFTYPLPVGVRPDGSLVVLDEGRVWSVKDGHSTELAGEPAHGSGYAAMDHAGTTYMIAVDQTSIGDMLVIPQGKPPHTLRVSGHVPGGSAPISGLKVLTVAPAADGFYTLASTADEKTAYLLHVHGTSADVLARAANQGDATTGCPTGKQYPALDNPCTMPWFAAPLGNRILLLGEINAENPTPALILRQR